MNNLTNKISIVSSCLLIMLVSNAAVAEPVAPFMLPAIESSPLLLAENTLGAGDHPYTPEVDEQAQMADFEADKFGDDPDYEDEVYDYQKELDVYGGKFAIKTQRPLIELGQELYQYGAFQPRPDYLGEGNLMMPQLLVYGDFRTAVAYNDNGNVEKGVWGNRLNLEVDLKLTATERIHAFFRPLDKGARFAGYEFSGGDKEKHVGGFDANLDALFFEGDLGAILAGITGEPSSFDLPIAAGFMPLIFQNGIWVEDAFTGIAFTLPAKNSPLLDWSNYDITFFAAFDQVTSRALDDKNNHNAHIYGATAFIEANQGYWEVGYGYTDDKGDRDLDYHNLTIAFTSRFRNIVSNSMRIIYNVGQDPKRGKNSALGKRQTADGVLFLIENSYITSKPSTVVPYFNMFLGIDNPQSLARAAGAGGVLKNTGINFETDGLTGFPKLDDTANNTYGAALGLNLIGDNFENQLIVEAAYLSPFKGDSNRKAPGNQYAIGVRYQHPITNAIILRADSIYGWRDELEDLFGARFEVRYKF